VARARRVAVAIIEREGKILIARRGAGRAFAGLWELPGGRCRDGEGFAECALREVAEETGLQVRVEAPAAIVRHRYPDFAVEIHAFFCTALAGEAKPLASDCLQWVTWDELEHYRFPAANQELFAQARRRRAPIKRSRPSRDRKAR